MPNLSASSTEAPDSLISASSSKVNNADLLNDSLSRLLQPDTLAFDSSRLSSGVILQKTDLKSIEKKRWVPDPKKAMWLAIAFPGGGQIYNRKYWKLPIVYGGFLGCFYALNWNNTMYRDYSQAYMDIMDSDPNTQSYLNFVRRGVYDESKKEQMQDQLKRKKDFYRRYRDMSMFCMIGVYLISIVDAYVDAEMSSFDISRDLSIKVSPAIFNDNTCAFPTSFLKGSSYGLNCSLTF